LSYDYRAKKTVIALASSLSMGVALNVVGHLCVALGAYGDKDLMGREALEDADGNRHVGISKYPVIITKVKQGRLRRLVNEARDYDGLFLGEYTEQMLTTGHDDELAEAMRSIPGQELSHLGVLLYGDEKAISELTGRFTLWQ
jgi:hypothetical protein